MHELLSCFDVNWFKALQLMLISSFKFFFAIPISYKMKFDFLQTVVFTSTGGIAGVFIYFYLSSWILWLYRKYLKKYYLKTRNFLFSWLIVFLKRIRKKQKKKNKRIFTRRNKLIVKVKRKWGLWGIAFFTPILLSIPLGTFLATKYYAKRNVKSILISLSIAIISWSIILSGFISFFKIKF